jgi:K+-transporting ATPase ATPase C chain
LDKLFLTRKESMFIELVRSFRLTALTIFGCVVVYTALVLATAAILAPEKRLGSLIYGPEGKVIGSRLVAQAFSSPKYLWPRPSAVDYNAAGAGGSNLSPANPKIRERAEAILATYALEDRTTLPADLVTASGSGLDPHVTFEAALVQADRIATSRQIDVATVRELLQKSRMGLLSRPDSNVGSTLQPDGLGSPSYGWGDRGLINVLEFNLLLDSQLNSRNSP